MRNAFHLQHKTFSPPQEKKRELEFLPVRLFFFKRSFDLQSLSTYILIYLYSKSGSFFFYSSSFRGCQPSACICINNFKRRASCQPISEKKRLLDASINPNILRCPSLPSCFSRWRIPPPIACALFCFFPLLRKEPLQRPWALREAWCCRCRQTFGAALLFLLLSLTQGISTPRGSLNGDRSMNTTNVFSRFSYHYQISSCLSTISMAIFNPSVDGYAHLVWKVQKQGRRAATFSHRQSV